MEANQIAESDIDTVSEYVEGEGSGYTIMAQRVAPDEHPAIAKQGYNSPTTLFTVLAGAEVYSHYNRHKLVRELPGSNDWLHQHLKRLNNKVQ